MRIKYHIPPQTSNWKVAGILLKDIGEKLLHSLYYLFRKKAPVKRHYELLAIAEGRKNN